MSPARVGLLKKSDIVRLRKWADEAIDSMLSSLFVAWIDYDEGGKKFYFPYLVVPPNVQTLIAILKRIVKVYVHENPSLEVSRSGYKVVVKDLVTHVANLVGLEKSSPLNEDDLESLAKELATIELPVWASDVLCLSRRPDDNSGSGNAEADSDVFGRATLADRLRLFNYAYMPVERAVCDIVCSLTESQAVALHRRLLGASSSSELGRVF